VEMSDLMKAKERFDLNRQIGGIKK